VEIGVNRIVSVFAAAALMAFANASATAQQQTQRVVGTIASLDGAELVVKTRQGDVKVQLTDNVAVSGVVRRTLGDIGLGAFIGVGAMPQADGSQRAVRINIFPEGQRPNEGHRSWDGAPQGTMTNATVAASVAGVDGHVLTVKYRDGEKKIVITPETQIVASLPGDRSELKPGASVLITQAVKKPDGTLEAARINVGRDGVVP
jgi:hypothetical protein